MSFECTICHERATGRTGEDRHYQPASYGRCETCKLTKDCYHCSCHGDWLKARQTAAAEQETNNV